MNRRSFLFAPLAAIPAPAGRAMAVRYQLTPNVDGSYPAITDGPVLAGKRLLDLGVDYWISGDTMRGNWGPTEIVSTFLPVWVEITNTNLPTVVKRKP